jgi:hypothetical protein
MVSQTVFGGHRLANYSRDLGRSITDEEHSSLQKKIDTFKNWFSDRVFDINQKTIVIVPYDNPEPHYRHEPKRLVEAR